VTGEELARLWKDADEQRDWPDDEHPAGQMYLHMVGGYGVFDGLYEPDPPGTGPNPSWPFTRTSHR
jgi:hypothetical protein